MFVERCTRCGEWRQSVTPRVSTCRCGVFVDGMPARFGSEFEQDVSNAQATRSALERRRFSRRAERQLNLL